MNTVNAHAIRPVAVALLTILSLAALARAQSPLGDKHVYLAESRVEPAAAAPGGEAELVFELFTDANWHVYGALETIGVPPKVVLDPGVATTDGGTIVPPGVPHESYGIESFWIEGEFTLRQKVKLDAGLEPGEATISGRIDYTVCDPSVCLPPDSIPFTLTVSIGEGDGEGMLDGDAEALEDEPDWTLEDVEFEEGKKLAVYDAEVSDPFDGQAGSEHWLTVKLHTAEGWHVYGAKETTGRPPRLIFPEERAFDPVGDPELPDGEPHDVAGLESHWVEGPFVLRQKIRVKSGLLTNTYNVEGEVEFMACDDAQCLPPTKVAFGPTILSVSDAGGFDEGMPDGGASESEDGATVEEDEEEEEPSYLAFILAAIGAGIFALSMPCTYPMIPITISFFTKQAEQRGGSAVGLSIVYGAGIVLMFIAIGLIFSAGFLDPGFAQLPSVNFIIGVLFVVFGLSLFGLFTLQPPQFLMNAASKAQSTSGLIGVLLMGATLVITSFTCSAPFIAGIIAVGAQVSATHIVIGMGVFGLTMAVPFVALSLLPGKARSMPKAGEWMNTVKVFFGFVEIAAALKFFSNAEIALGWNILPKWLFLGLWAIIFAASALYLFGAFTKGASIGPRQRVAAAAVLLLAHYCTWGAAGGPIDKAVMIPLAPPYNSFGAEKTARSHVIVADDFEQARQRAIDEKKLLLINFTGVT